MHNNSELDKKVQINKKFGLFFLSESLDKKNYPNFLFIRTNEYKRKKLNVIAA